MPPAIIGAGIAAAGGLASAAIGSKASSNAAKAQQQAADTAAQTQQHIFDQQTELQAPFRAGGLTSQNRLLELLGLSPAADSGLTVNTAAPDFGKYSRDFGMSDFQTDPGYQFRLDQGIKALNNSMAARGLGISGSNIKGAAEYGQNLASGEYQNAFNRYQVNRSNQLNPLQSMMGAGQTSANTLTSAAGQMGQNVSDLQTQAGNARASGYIGSANALAGGLNSAINNGLGAYYQSQYMNRAPVYNPNGGGNIF